MLQTKNPLITISFICLLGISSGAHSQVYRCEVNGQTVFSQTPCAPEAEAIRTEPTAPSAAPRGLRPGEIQNLRQQSSRTDRERARAAEHNASERDRARLEEATRARQVVPGMTPEQVRRAWGSPSRVNVTDSRYSYNEQWVYERENYRRDYVHFRNGLVTSVSR
ncbi:hypothetical protein Tgr7_0379 [Thioalkalivibrio sulfidiphilus HL-EbGr7]|uniref:Uncharacterized protein n=1 Tax=Thioalkalivibrio sulfidiphilus (strain HL-EbGR7) TaxID=396588 RepID=B8GUW6_THISH|nr:DUF4124 domain-containing protein [Thioalkalivibrio sulfidiphilus]ACL71477.1 hypothetical protein Tgr7_0379 [Thioalkalivibrio sulfidiphilus HL-EbGr7]